tara:strand:- start:82 stop:534 length:453 start_codon:yes stop_codon:yes gene_type:complete
LISPDNSEKPNKMKLTKTKLKQIIKEELQVVLTNEEVEEMFGEEVRDKVENMEEALGMDQEAQLSTKVIPLLMQIAGGNKNVASEMVDKLGGLISELPELDERKLTKGEKKEKEKVVKGMKKSKGDFEKRYGKDAESVMYATATKIAKEK